MDLAKNQDFWLNFEIRSHKILRLVASFRMVFDL